MGDIVLAAAQFTIDPAAPASRVDATTAYDGAATAISPNGAASATGLQPDADGDAAALSIALKKHVPGNACAPQHSEAHMRPHTHPVWAKTHTFNSKTTQIVKLSR